MMQSFIIKILIITLTSLLLTTCTSRDNSQMSQLWSYYSSKARDPHIDRRMVARICGTTASQKQFYLTDEWSHIFVAPLPARNNFTAAPSTAIATITLAFHLVKL